MHSRKSRFIRMGSRVGAGVVVAAVLAVVPLSPSSATHLTSINLNNTTVGQGTTAVLTGTVNGSSDCADTYGWHITSSIGTVGGTFHQLPGGPAAGTFTVTVNTSALAQGNHAVTVTADWLASAACDDGPNSVDVATLRVTTRNGAFQCSAYAARTQTDYQPANPAHNPCRDENNYFGQLQPILGLGNIGVTRSTTDSQPNNLNDVAPTLNDYGDAQAHIAGVDLNVNGIPIRIGAAWVQASVNCKGGFFGGQPKVNANGTVATINLNNRSFGTTSGYVNVWLPGVRVELNKTWKTNSGRQIHRQAIKITNRFNGQTIVIGEAHAGWSGTPCSGFNP